MVGCLGGLGRSLSKWIFDRGARKFVFIGRSGTEKASAKTLVDSLRETGATVVVVKGDVSRLDDVKTTVEKCPSPIGGVIQAAMGLNVSITLELILTLGGLRTNSCAGSIIYKHERGILALGHRR